jgi:hypothetical protein
MKYLLLQPLEHTTNEETSRPPVHLPMHRRNDRIRPPFLPDSETHEHHEVNRSPHQPRSPSLRCHVRCGLAADRSVHLLIHAIWLHSLGISLIHSFIHPAHAASNSLFMLPLQADNLCTRDRDQDQTQHASRPVYSFLKLIARSILPMRNRIHTC